MKEVGTIKTTAELIQQIIDTLKEITDKFYLQDEMEGYRLLRESLDLIATIMERLLSNSIEDQVPELYQEIIQYLNEALQAMEAKDTILLADILQYELLERFQVVLDTLE